MDDRLACNEKNQAKQVCEIDAKAKDEEGDKTLYDEIHEKCLQYDFSKNILTVSLMLRLASW